MYFPEAGRHIAVCGVRDAPAMLRRDQRFWYVVSIYSPEEPAPIFAGAREVHRVAFLDVEDPRWAADTGAKAAHQEDIAGIFKFVATRPGAPMLVHCRAGVSRSTAVALGLIAQGHHQQGKPGWVTTAVDQLLSIRPRAVPNNLVLRLAFRQFMDADQADQVAAEALEHPTLIENRARNPTRQEM